MNRMVLNVNRSEDSPMWRKLTWKEWLFRLFKKPFIQTQTTYKDGIIIISADNPNPARNRTKYLIYPMNKFRRFYARLMPRKSLYPDFLLFQNSLCF